MSLARVGISQSMYSKERIVAQYLAHDAMQYIVNMHYNDIKNHDEDDFNTYIRGRCLAPLGCRIDTTSNNYNSAIKSCDASGCPQLRRNGTEYQYSGGPPGSSPYTRSIYASVDLTEPHDTEVKVVVTWVDGSGEQRTIEIYRHFLAIGGLLGS